MNPPSRRLASGVALALCSLPGRAELIVDTGLDDADVAAALVASGIDIVPGSVSFTGDPLQRGAFSGGTGAGLGIESGVVLGTGDANRIDDDNSDDAVQTAFDRPGDPRLTGLLGPGTSTLDAALLGFDFTSASGDLFFRFVFGSEEFPDGGDEFPDVFALFVDGVNVALLPNDEEVSAGEVRACDGSSDPGCDVYVDNPELVGTGLTPFGIEFDGFTRTLSAGVTGLTAGTHSLVFGITDADDDRGDSAVFVERGSFSADPFGEVPEPASLALLAAGVGAFVPFARRRRRDRNEG